MPHQITTKVDANDPAFLYLNLHPDERIELIVRHHWAGFLGMAAIVIAMALFPVFLVFAANLAFSNSLVSYRDLINLGLSGYYLFLLTFLFGAWINFYYDVIFITSERIINVSQEGLLARKTSELSLKQVQNVSADLQGFLQSLFNYGLLVIETAGEGTSDDPHRPGTQGYFTIHDVPDPNFLARTISELHRAIEHEDTP